MLAGIAALFAAGCLPGRVGHSSTSGSPAFTLGADISALATPGRRRPLPAFQENGTPSDELTILRRHGWSSYRLRVFLSPVRNAPDNSLERMIPLAKQVKASGALLLSVSLSTRVLNTRVNWSPGWKNAEVSVPALFP